MSSDANEAEASCSEQPHKKQKLDDEGELEVKLPITIDSLPDEMLVEIFKNLTFEERLLALKVCSRWCKLAQSEVFWKYVKVTDISASQLIEIFSYLPSCVSHLQCHNEEYTSIYLTLPATLVKLNNKCPTLKTLILENINFINNCPTGVVQYTFEILDNSLPLCPVFEINDGDFNEEEEFELMDAVLPELEVLSLRNIKCSPLHLFTHMSASVLPNLVALDLTLSVPAAVIENKGGLFSSLVHLEELYLVGWDTQSYNIDTFLKNVRKLRVLDLESSIVTSNTITALKKNSAWLEELYLGRCPVDISKTAADEVFFPRLRKLCLRNTNVTMIGVEEIMNDCPLLESVNLSFFARIHRDWWENLPLNMKEKIELKPPQELICNHFLNSKHCERKEMI